MNLKLNYKKVLSVGIVFMFITAFWYGYNSIVPKILTDKFGLSQVTSGAIMALDNVLAVFLLPVFGALSDKSKSKHGRRTPFIFWGTIISAVLLVLVSVADYAQLGQLQDVSPTSPEAYEQSLEELWEANPTFEYGKEQKPLQEHMSKQEFLQISMYQVDENGGATSMVTEEYAKIVVPARQAYAKQISNRQPLYLIIFVVVLLLLLVAMGTFRSPAVALMPDVTVKPLRSQGNAMINLMGSLGVLFVLVLGMVLGTGRPDQVLMDYRLFFGIIAIYMVAALIAFLALVKEKKWSAEMEADAEQLTKQGIVCSEEDEQAGERKLSRGEIASLILILASVVLWYMGYNAMESKLSVYMSDALGGIDYNIPYAIGGIMGIVSYFPIGKLSAVWGRKKTVLAGVGILAVAFGVMCFVTTTTPVWVTYAVYAAVGASWAAINVNSYPMVVELAKGSNVGKYTGFYYTASMSAQIITPILCGVFLEIDMRTLFPYATVCIVLAFFTMLFVKHGDTPRLKKKEH